MRLIAVTVYIAIFATKKIIIIKREKVEKSATYTHTHKYYWWDLIKKCIKLITAFGIHLYFNCMSIFELLTEI